jgi:ABC-type ATPase with predicted acetyltransferase domain
VFSGTPFVTTPKVIEAKVGEQVHFFLTYTTPDNYSVFTVSNQLGNDVIKIVGSVVNTDSSWIMVANVEVSAVDDNVRKVNITIHNVNFQIHDGQYIVKVNGSDGMGQDDLLIRTIGKSQLRVSFTPHR